MSAPAPKAGTTFCIASLGRGKFASAPSMESVESFFLDLQSSTSHIHSSSAVNLPWATRRATCP